MSWTWVGSALTALGVFLRPYIMPLLGFFGGWDAKGKHDEIQGQELEIGALQKALQAHREVDALPAGAALEQLRQSWNEKDRRTIVRGGKPDIH